MTNLLEGIKITAISLAYAITFDIALSPTTHAGDCEQIHTYLRICFNTIGNLVINEDLENVKITLKAARGEDWSRIDGHIDKNKFSIYYKYNGRTTNVGYIDCINKVYSNGVELDSHGRLIDNTVDPNTGIIYSWAINNDVKQALVNYFCDGKLITRSPQMPSTDLRESPEPSIPTEPPKRPTLRETLSDTPFQWKY